jgi:hypothetical protein
MPWSKTTRSLPITRSSPHRTPVRPSPPHDPDESKRATDTMDIMTSRVFSLPVWKEDLNIPLDFPRGKSSAKFVAPVFAK